MKTYAVAIAAVLVTTAFSPVSALAQVSPISVTGWNHDMVLNNPSPYDLAVTGTMDGGLGQVENWTWVEKGDYTNADGNIESYEGFVAGVHSSLTGNGEFEFQSFSENNAVALDSGQSGDLLLDTPASYSSIALYGAAGFGGKSASVTVNFTDSSTALFSVAEGAGIGTDWFNGNADKAYEARARAANKSEEGYTRLFYQQNDAIGINESIFYLDPADFGKSVESVTVENLGGDRMVVFAISGQAVPEPTSAALLAGVSLLAFAARRHSA